MKSKKVTKYDFFFELAEKVFTVFTLFVSSGAVIVTTLLPQGGSGEVEGSPLFQLMWFCIYAITLFLITIQWRGFTRIPNNLDLPVLLLVGIALFSYFWSDVPQLTLRRSIALVGTTLFGVYFATRYHPKQQLRLLAWTFGIAAVLSVIFALFLPSYGLDVYPFAGVWRGVYQQKNLLGRYMVLSSTIFMLTSFVYRNYRWILLTIFSLSIALILLSTSKTSLIVLLTLLVLIPIYKTLHWGYTKFLPLSIITVLIIASFAILITSEAETILGFFGKDVTLTGRTQLWVAVIEMIKQHPWLGYGYSAFWLGNEGASTSVWAVIGWPAPHAHNGFLDLWLDLGLLGVLVFVISYLKSFIKALNFVRYGQSWEDLWPILYLTFILLLNISQSALLHRNSIIWILYVAINLHKPMQIYR